jgi:hypothetical protein
MYELERLTQDIPTSLLKFLTSSGIASGLVLALPPVVAGPESVGVVCLIDEGAVGFKEFFYRRPEAAG